MADLDPVAQAGGRDVDAIVDVEHAADGVHHGREFRRCDGQLPRRPARLAQLHGPHPAGDRCGHDRAQARDVPETVRHEQQARRRERRYGWFHAAS